MKLWFSSPPESPLPASPPTFGEHGVLPCASHTESGPSLITELNPKQLTWTCDKHGSSEATSFYIRFDDDSFGFGQFIYSSIGLSPTVQLYFRYWSPNNGQMAINSNLSGSSLKLSADKCSINYANSKSKFALAGEDGKCPIYEVDLFPKDQNSGISFKFTSLTPAVQIKSGKTQLQPHGHSHPLHFYHYFVPIGKIEGTLHVDAKNKRPVTGYATIIHGTQSSKPHLIATRWDCFQLLDGPKGDAILMLQCKTPGQFSKQAVTQSMVVRGGKIICCSTRSYARHETTAVDPKSHYPIPKSVEYKWEGVTVDEKKIEALCKVESKVLTTCVDILAELPFLLRKVLQVLIAKPFSYMWWDKGKVSITIGDGEKYDMEGMIYHETTFLNPS